MKENLIRLVLLLILVAAYMVALAHGERTTRAQIRAACPSGTAERVCDRVEADMMREPFGRVCVLFSRWIGGVE